MARKRFRDATRVRDPYLGTETVVKKCPECGKEFHAGDGFRLERSAVMQYDEHYESEHVRSTRGRITVEMDAPAIGSVVEDEERARDVLRKIFEYDHGGSDVEVLDIELVDSGGDT